MGKALGKIAMLAVAIFAPYAAAALGLTGISATIFSFVAQGVVGSLVGGGGLFGGGDSGVRDTGYLVNQTGGVKPIPIVYGNRRLAGTRVYIETTNGAGNKSGDEYLQLVYAISEGEIASIDNIYFNDQLAWTKAGGVQSPYTGLAFIEVKLGTQTQAPSSTMLAKIGSDWTSSMQGRGVAWIYVQLKYDRDQFPSLPTIQCDIQGRRVYDVTNISFSGDAIVGSRTSTTSELRNPANCIFDYLTDQIYGKGLKPSEIDLASFQSAHDYYEAYAITFDGAINPDDTMFNNVQKQLLGSNSYLVFTNGQYVLKVNRREATPSFTFSESNIIGGWQIVLGSKKTRYNRLKVNYFNPDLGWNPDMVIIENTTYLAEDSGTVSETEIDLQFTSDTDLATRIGTFLMDLSRHQISVQFTAAHMALELSVGDVVYITHGTPGWTQKPFRIIGLVLNQDSTVEVSAVEYADVYDIIEG
jgi:hypothetical protein